MAKAAGDRLQVMVVGLGMVGIAFIEKMLTLDTAGRYFVRTCGEEPVLAYNRVGLTEYFAHRNIEDLYLAPLSWYEEQDPTHFAYHVGERVIAVDHNAKRVQTTTGKEFSYDILVLATGSIADLPKYVSQQDVRETEGIFVYRSIADLEAIIEYAARPTTKRATVVGAGLLGLEAAKAVQDMPGVSDVSLVIRGDFPLNRQLDSAAGELVLGKIRSLGVTVHTRCSPSGIVTRESEGGRIAFAGFKFDGPSNKPEEIGMQEEDMVIFAIGIKPRDDLAGANGVKLHVRGGIEINDDLSTSVPGIYAIGECASWRGNFYGLIAPGVEMADILAFNLTQVGDIAGSHAPRVMNAPDLSTRLKLMGVDVASFGDYFADQRADQQTAPEKVETTKPGQVAMAIKPSQHIKLKSDPVGPVRCLTYHDPFGATYKKYIFSADGRHLIGGIMVGDVGDFTKLVAIAKKGKALDVPPSQFILGAKVNGEDNGDELDDDAVICSCHNVTKGAIGQNVREGVNQLAQIKSKTKAGTGCGGCLPLVTSIFNAEMKKAGHTLNTNLCIHFSMSRQDLLQVIKVKRLRDFTTIVETVGTIKGSQGCEICKPVVASILASFFNEHVMQPEHHGLQDTNDRYMANIQRNGTFSVVPRMAGGECTPKQLIAIGHIADEYNLYTKVTGGQRIDMFGAQKPDLPDIWAKLHAAGLECGYAYGKSLRTVKSCVGTSWCRFGVGDSVGLAVDLENRYKGIRAPHKIKGGVSGCVRECAEAQSKDFGLIATDKGWNIFIGGNGGAKPRHAQLFAQDVPPSKVTRILDRFLMFYIRTAGRLVRTAPWVESFSGGIEKLKKILLEDELGVCSDLEAEMQHLVATYEDEWMRAVENDEMKKKFRQFANTAERQLTVEAVQERGQQRAADWPKNFPPLKFEQSALPTPQEEWRWVPLAHVSDLGSNEKGATSVAVKYGDSRLAIFHAPGRGYYATQQMCPHKRAFVLDHGLVGDDAKGDLYVSCPLHKRNFKLDSGECTNDADYSILAFEVRKTDEDTIELKLPPADELDSVIGTFKWKVTASTAKELGPNAATGLSGISFDDDPVSTGTDMSSSRCGTGGALDW